MRNGAILWEGPSEIDGSPVVVVATGLARPSGNLKTGRMVQIWILGADASPVELSRAGRDGAVCGECPQRRSLGGGCYVTLHQAPSATWHAYRAGRYAPIDEAQRERMAALPVRLGAYGDPGAVPGAVWTALVAGARAGWTGYTHRWRRRPDLRGVCMASCDTASEYAEARAAGWRAFVALAPDAPRPPGAVECLSDARGTACAECRICDGTREGRRSTTATSVWITVHGALQRRALRVVQ
jgi:hypothetical protein